MDSGVGGLTVLRQIVKILPNESYIFVGDQANLPYGQKSSATVKALTKRIADYMLTQNVKLFVIACNTSTAASLEYLQQILPIPVIGVIAPGSDSAVKTSATGQIGVIATNGTVRSGDYQRIITNLNPESHVYTLGCPEFVTMVEQGLAGTQAAQVAVNNRLAYFSDLPIDTLVMGCTHFPVLSQEIQNVVGQRVSLVDPGIATAQKVAEYLNKHQQLSVGAANIANQFHTTGNPAEFAKIAENLLNKKVVADHLDI
ncbi:glutamate racemase [Lentilactobacillus sp. TOM.63]|uniref:glutamate racemase n=1 Tax=Lentilactobacillus sp. TOM.63 TaxID=3055077 RepID=UPI0025A290EE|nr:glutamate racemase [Lentilactobacillus sp. TOM.63]MDM7516196.1 glutamate racemase [Lentilactobacillus sp. TOM.63]